MNRIKCAREARGFSAVELAEKLQVHPSTLNNWEAERRQIAPEKLVQLAELLDYSVDYLLGRDYPSVSLTKPVDKKMLPVLHGQPVWTESYGWMLVNIVQKAFIQNNLNQISFNEIQEPIYIIPPNLSLSLRGIGHPLKLESILQHERVWVEPVTSDTDLADAVRGWYLVYENRLAQNEFGNRFYLDTYGVKWLAFETCIER